MSSVPSPRALTATIVVVGPPERTREALDVLHAIARRASVRNILITLGDNPEPEIRTEGDVVTIEGLVPRYLNNAVARLRVSSMPLLAWWRGGQRQELEDLAELVDRVALDSVDPREDWAVVDAIARMAAISDLRWTRLTRWRSLMAQFFDTPETRASGLVFSTLKIAAGDAHAGRLFAGWLASRLPAGDRLNVTLTDVEGGATIESVTLSGGDTRLSLRLLANRDCIESAVAQDGQVTASRIGPAGDERLEALLGEELRVRSRDVAFEEALRLMRVVHD
ncbi:MAG: OpcA/G6PD domain-containing protein [Vicinamibacterales bacterium]